MKQLRQIPPAAWVMISVGIFTLVASAWLIRAASQNGFTVL